MQVISSSGQLEALLETEVAVECFTLSAHGSPAHCLIVCHFVINVIVLIVWTPVLSVI